jgi:hypothetical protein
MSGKPSFFAELKRRNVYNVAVAYAVVGWLVIQVTATIVPALHLPDGLTTAVVVLTLVGFPVALVIAWAFEMTPEGMKRTEDGPPNESITSRTGRKLIGMTMALALIAAALLVFQLLRSSSPVTAPKASVAPAIPEKSIAVLPFVDMSEAKDQDYFCDGIRRRGRGRGTLFHKAEKS